nr:beta-lactamase family protein [Clostridia bacterium]
MRRMLALWLTLLLAFSSCVQGEDAPRLDDWAAARFREWDVVGGAVIIMKDGEVLYSYDYGYKQASRRETVTLDTCFHAASVTKMISAVGLMQLLEDYDISLDTPVKDIVGIPVVNPAFPDAPITIRQVLSHTSSFVQNQYLTPDWSKIGKNNGYFSTVNAPGTAYEYANMNGGLIGAMIEAISGKSVNDYMQRYVFVPLKINAAYHAALLPDPTDVADKLQKNGKTFRTAENEFETFKDYDDSCFPALHTNITSGSLYISVNGLIRIVQLLQNGGVLEGKRILTEETVRLMMSPQHLVQGSSVTGESPYGLCITTVDDLPGGTWYGHQGMWQGLTSNAYFQPDTGLCIAMIANGYNADKKNGVVTIARAFMEKAQELLE